MKHFNLLAFLITLLFSSCGPNNKPIEQPLNENQMTETLKLEQGFTEEDVENLSSLLKGNSFSVVNFTKSNGKVHSEDYIFLEDSYFSPEYDSAITETLHGDEVFTVKGKWKILLDDEVLFIRIDTSYGCAFYQVFEYGANHYTLVRSVFLEDGSHDYVYLHYLMN
jgi:hypothetical protein